MRVALVRTLTGGQSEVAIYVGAKRLGAAVTDDPGAVLHALEIIEKLRRFPVPMSGARVPSARVCDLSKSGDHVGGTACRLEGSKHGAPRRIDEVATVAGGVVRRADAVSKPRDADLLPCAPATRGEGQRLKRSPFRVSGFTTLQIVDGVAVNHVVCGLRPRAGTDKDPLNVDDPLDAVGQVHGPISV